MRPQYVSQLLAKLIEARLPGLLSGAPGVGKSDLVEQAAKAAKADLIVSHPVVSDPTEAKGLPWLKEGSKMATFLPFEDLYRALNAKKLTVWNLEDLGQAAPQTQASYMQLLLARRANGQKLPDCVTFIASTNRRTDRAGVAGILEPVKSRFVSIINVEPNLEDWCGWAIKNDMPPELIAFLRFRDELLHQFNPTLDLVNSPCPRTWASCGKLLKLGLSDRVELQALQGAVGEGAANELVGFLRIWRELPSLDEILVDPDAAPIPEKPASLYATAVGLAAKANPNNFDRVARYAERLNDSTPSKGEFAVLLIRDAVRRNRAVCNTPAYIKLASSEVGKLFTGEED